MTKAQEREALQRIRNIIADAGPDSYIGMAFSGCCEIAADNIENDFGDSMKQRAESAEHERDELLQHVDAMSAEIMTLKKQLKEARETLTQQAEQLKAARIPADLYKRLWLAVEAQREAAAADLARVSDLLADIAAEATPDALRNCARSMATAKARREEAAALLADLEKIAPAGC